MKKQKVIYSKETPYTSRLTDCIQEILNDGYLIVSVTPQHIAGTGSFGFGGFLIVFEKEIKE